MRFGVTGNRKVKEFALKSALFALFCWLAIGLFLENLILSLLIAIVFGFCLFGFLLYLPIAQRRKHALLIESQLPFALMSIAVELGLGLRFEEVLRHAAGLKGAIGKEFLKTWREIAQQGASVQDALMHFAERVDSLEVKRAIALFVSVYEQGHRAGGETVKRLAKELLAKQRAEAKEFSGKLVVYSLLFIAVSAVVPALFQSFVVVGSMVLYFTITAQQVFVIITGVFPMVDLMALCYIRAKTPVFLRG